MTTIEITDAEREGRLGSWGAWDDDEFESWASGSHRAGNLAYELATHSGWYHDGLNAVRALPDELFPGWDDAGGFVNSLLSDAGRWGYLVGKLETVLPDVRPAHQPLTNEMVAKALAALLDVPLEPKEEAR